MANSPLKGNFEEIGPANVVPVGNAANTTENDLMLYTLPAGTLAVDGQGIRVTAWGTGVNTADATTLRGYFGATEVFEVILTASQPNLWRVTFDILRTGAATQAGCTLINVSPFSGGTHSAIVQLSTPTEILNNAIIIKLTGQRASTAVADSITQVAMLVQQLP